MNADAWSELKFPNWKPEPWVEQAACRPDSDMQRASNVRLFFPDKGNFNQQSAYVRRLCGSCPVRTDCLDYADRNFIRHGIWGGLSTKQRQNRRAAAAKASRESHAESGLPTCGAPTISEAADLEG